MKTSGAILIFAALLFVTPRWLFPVCDSATMACHHTLIAETWLALALLAVAFIRHFWRPLIHILLPISILISLFPLFITGVCHDDRALCRLGTQPALITLSVLLLLFYFITLIPRRGTRHPTVGLEST